jgi:multimeric flavodoxin WrbA
MKIIGIICSLRTNGNTAVLVRQSLKGAADISAEVEEIFLPEFHIEYCKGCFTCMAKGKCSVLDDFQIILDKILAADGIIISSPSYALAPTACMKTLLDRIGMYNAYTSSLGGKYVVSISTAGAMGAKKVAKELAGLVANGLFKRGFISGQLAVNVGFSNTCTDPVVLNKAYLLGQKIASDINNKKRYSLQNLSRRIFNKLILKRIFTQNILRNKDGKMRAVYLELKKQGFIAG